MVVCERVCLSRARIAQHTCASPCARSFEEYGVLRRLILSLMTNLRGYEQAEDESLEPDVVIVINGYGYVGKTTLCLGLAGGDVHSEYLLTVSDGTLWH